MSPLQKLIAAKAEIFIDNSPRALSSKMTFLQ